MRTPLNDLGEEIIDVNRANGFDSYNREEAWDEEFTVPAALALIHSETSEALEDFRHDRKEHFGEELADVLIRVIDLGVGLGFDLDAEVRRKLEKNRGRSYRHGGKRA